VKIYPGTEGGVRSPEKSGSQDDGRRVMFVYRGKKGSGFSTKRRNGKGVDKKTTRRKGRVPGANLRSALEREEKVANERNRGKKVKVNSPNW